MAGIEIMATREQRKFLGTLLFDDTCSTIAYGGARFGGKTWAACVGAIAVCLKYPGVQVLMIRRVIDSAKQNIGKELRDVANQNFKMPPGVMRERLNEKQFVFANGSLIQLGYCRLDRDWENHKGTQWDFIFMEEATQFTEGTYQGLSGSNRRSSAAPDGFRPKMVLTTNPDGIGLRWVRRRMINEKTRDAGVVFIQSLVADCLATLEHAPDYVQSKLKKLPKHLQKQWIDGDWDVMEGAFWEMPQELLQSVKVPKWAVLYAGVDWGYGAGAFAVVIGAFWTDYVTGQHRVHLFREIKQHHRDFKEQAELALGLADEIARDPWMPNSIRAWFADPACWKTRGESMNSTIASSWASYHWVVSEAFSNARVPGWNLMRTTMNQGILTIDPEGCPCLVQEMVDAPAERSGEDLDPAYKEDHCMDCARYLLGSIFPTGVVPVDENRAARMERAAKQKEMDRVASRLIETAEVG